MALSRSRRRLQAEIYWPGFVDAMATLLLVIIFLLSFFMLAQFFLTQEISGKDTVLRRLNAQIAELTQLLALEQGRSDAMHSELAALSASLADAEQDRQRLQGLLGENDNLAAAGGQDALDEAENLSERARAQVALLNQQITALRRQIGALEAALEASEAKDQASQTRIADLGRRLNVALAQRVQELAKYRSDFFGRLRQILSQRSDIRVVGDRFVFQSEVLFPSGSAEINPQGQEELSKLASALQELEGTIPEDIEWVLRVDGHTDARPLSGAGQFESNWDLSVARAVAVVESLVQEGVDPQHLAAAGFGEHQPLQEGDSPADYAANRRIEFKLTER
jgi:chemotaxis protein MotB